MLTELHLTPQKVLALHMTEGAGHIKKQEERKWFFVVIETT